MGEVSGGRLVAKALKAEGVKYIFTLNGGHIYNIFEGCADEGIDIIDVRHEQVAGHAAEGWGRRRPMTTMPSKGRWKPRNWRISFRIYPKVFKPLLENVDSNYPGDKNSALPLLACS